MEGLSGVYWKFIIWRDIFINGNGWSFFLKLDLVLSPPTVSLLTIGREYKSMLTVVNTSHFVSQVTDRAKESSHNCFTQ